MKSIKINEDSIIYSSDNNKYDIIIIKIKDEDEINNYLEIEENIFKDEAENMFKNESIYILHHPNGNEASISYGCGIEKISYYDIKHECNTDHCSSGGPIINSLNNKVIGIHKGYLKRKGFNIGTFLKFPLNELLKIQNISLFICFKGRKYEFFLPLSTTIRELREKFTVKTGININNEKDYILYNMGFLLHNDRSLEYYEFEDDDLIEVIHAVNINCG